MTDINGDPYTVLTNLSVDRLLVNGSPVAGGAAAGPNDSVQFNLSGNFTGDASFKWDNTGKVLSVIGSITATSINGISLTTGGSVDDSLRGDGTYQTITAGADTQLQFNNSGSLAGSANLTWDGLVLAVTGGITATTFNSIALTNGGAGNNYLDDSGSYSPATAGPAGANTQVQYNDAGTLGADANFTWDGFTLSITGAVIGTTFNSVALTNGGSVVNLLREDGTYNPLAWGEISGTLSNQIDLQVELDAKKNDFAENTAFNKNFGTSAGTVLEGNTVLGGAVDSVTGDGVGGTAVNPVMSFPVPSDIGLGNVDNTSDANKPVSTAQQTALNLKLNLSGGAMTGPVTSISTWTGTSFNGVALTTGGSINDSLRADGTYQTITAGSKTLQQAYVDGNTISVDAANGTVELDQTGETLPSFRLVPDATFPTTNLGSGALHPDTDGTLYSYDSTRSKWLSISEFPYHFTDNGNNDSSYLKIGNVASTSIGWVAPYDLTIITIEAIGEGNLTKTFDLEANTVSIETFSLVSGSYSDSSANININAGDILQCFATGAGASVNDPVVSIYTKRRK
jgi:hypothetical protein